MVNEKTRASEEQIAYAGVLNIGMWFGLFLLIATFFVYLSGVLPSFVAIEDLPKYWGMRVHDFNAQMHALWSMRVHDYNHIKKAPTGWHWTTYVNKGDYLNFVGIAILSGLTILCYLVILPILIRKKDRAYVVIAIAEVLVLSLAASGLLKAGGH